MLYYLFIVSCDFKQGPYCTAPLGTRPTELAVGQIKTPHGNRYPITVCGAPTASRRDACYKECHERAKKLQS